MFAQALGAEEQAVQTTMPSPTVPLYSPNPLKGIEHLINIHYFAGGVLVAYILYQYFYGEE